MDGICVKPLSRKQIRENTSFLRDRLKISGRFPIISVLEFIMPTLFSEDEYMFDVRAIDEMGKYHGATGSNYIYLREDVYNGACQGNGRDRFTAAHELAHYMYHREYVNLLHRQVSDTKHKIYCDSEWQANTFSSELLMPAELFEKCRCLNEVQEVFGVSYEAAQTRSNILFKEGLITTRLC